MTTHLQVSELGFYTLVFMGREVELTDWLITDLMPSIFRPALIESSKECADELIDATHIIGELKPLNHVLEQSTDDFCN